MSYSLKTAIGTGDIYANFIRQIAIRCTHSWQPIAFIAGERFNSIGFSGNKNYTIIDFLNAKISNENKATSLDQSSLIVDTMRKDDNKFVGDYFEIEGLGRINIDTIKVVFCYGSGTSSLERNSEYLEEITSLTGETDNVVFVSSRYTKVHKLSYIIEPLDDRYESGTFEGDTDYIVPSIKFAQEQLSAFLEYK